MVSEESRTPDPMELGGRLIEAFARGNADAVLAFFMPDAVWDASPMGLGVFEGRDALHGLWEDWYGAYEEMEQQLDAFRDLGHGVIFSVLHQRGRLPDSSGFVELRYASVSIWRDGLIERVTVYTDINEGSAAAEQLAEERG